MRKIKLQMQMTVDGFVSTGPNDEQQWVTWAWDELRQDVLQTIESCDTIVLGRKLAVDFIPYWNASVSNTMDPLHELAKNIVRCEKLIFSQSLADPKWNNTRVVTGKIEEEIAKIKSLPGKADVFATGGSSFVASLIRHNLVDEYNLYINPVAIGKGDPIFGLVDGFQRLKLELAKAYPSGIVLHRYVRA